MKTIAIDNGHGFNTSGKRTPKFRDGTEIREWQFNYPTAKKLGEILKYNNLNIVYVSDAKDDVKLKRRTDRANAANADLFVSIHFNALKGYWGKWGGIETYHYPNSFEGKKLATIVQNNLIYDTGLKNRKVKSANFHVLRETKMPAILCECGFMDNLEEAKLMLDEEYQMKCARAIARGICKHLGIEYKEPVEELESIKLNLHGQHREIRGICQDGVNYIPIRFLEKLGYKVGWDKENKMVMIDYKGEDK